MNLQVSKKLSHDGKICLILLGIFFTIYLFSNDGHRHTFDEDVTYQLTERIATQQPHPNYVQGESKIFFEYPTLFPPEKNPRAICLHEIWCSRANYGHAFVEVPIFLFHEFFPIIDNTNIFTIDDFQDNHYVSWRNDQKPNFVFLELLYGPLFSSLSIVIFYLISRSFSFSTNISILLSFIFGLSTLVWPYSQTSLNSVSSSFFILFGFLLFHKYIKNQRINYLISFSLIFGFAYLIRPDTLMFLIPIFGAVIYLSVKKRLKLHIPLFLVPVSLLYFLDRFLIQISEDKIIKLIVTGTSQYPTPFHVGFLGLLFSPGLGLFIFVPVLLTVFFSFFDFFKNHKFESILLISFSAIFLGYFSMIENWTGLVGWGPRYLIPIIPFLLLPLGASISKRSKKTMIAILTPLCSLGFIFNFTYVIQDVTWFVWGQFGGSSGLFGLARELSFPGRIHPVTLWTFEYSQLTHSINVAINSLQIDIYLFKVLGIFYYFLILTSILSIFFFILIYCLKKQN